jgi:hypothetical protein
MELEVIEPSLYLRMESGAARRFAKAFDAYVSRKQATFGQERLSSRSTGICESD